MPEGYSTPSPPITTGARVDPILFYFIPPIMHQNVSLRYLCFEQKPPFSWKAKSLHHTTSAGVKVFNPEPTAALLDSANPPGHLLVSQESELPFSALVQVSNPTSFFHSEQGRNMTGVHGNNICADVSSF